MPHAFKIFMLTGNIIGLMFVPLVLVRKRNPVSAIAWSLTAVFIPWFGVFFFTVVFAGLFLVAKCLVFGGVKRAWGHARSFFVLFV